ncbi:MAG TPA: fibronectin type III domain-containing protein [Terriglobales bacterium]|nr:fibronectin type III domain-containing protein [Terriglobales bacterium]
MKTLCRWISALTIALPLVCVPQLTAYTQNQTVKIINGPKVEGVGDNWAVIAWTTNTGGSSLVHYGTNQSSLSQTAESAYGKAASGAKSETHRVRIKNLQPDTTYYFQADSGQAQGTGTEAKSSVSSFKTKGAGETKAAGQGKSAAVKIIAGPRVEGTGNNWAVIAWTTNTGGSSVVHYGTSESALNQTGESPYADKEGAAYQTHRVRLKNLQPKTIYYFQVDSGQGEDTGTQAKSAVSQFKTH